MIFDEHTFDELKRRCSIHNSEFTLNELKERYHVHSIESHTDSVEYFDQSRINYYTSEEEVCIEMSGGGFRRMMQDLFRTPVDQGYFRTTFEIDKFCLQDGVPWVAKFDASHQDLDVIKVLAEKLTKEFPDKKIIFLPKDINIEAMGIEGLTALRDHLSSIIENLNYDNIMGF